MEKQEIENIIHERRSQPRVPTVTNLCDSSPSLHTKTTRQHTTKTSTGETRHSHDDGFGGISHLFAYMDDISATIPLEDVKFFCDKIQTLGTSIGCFMNPYKTQILTSCNGYSIIPELCHSNLNLALDIESAISTYSIKEGPDSVDIPVELTQGFRLLQTPVGSRTFTHKYYMEQIAIINRGTESLTSHITDLHIRLKLFAKCKIQNYHTYLLQMQCTILTPPSQLTHGIITTEHSHRVLTTSYRNSSNHSLVLTPTYLHMRC